MTYEQALEYIHSLLHFGIKPGLDRVGKLLDKMGNPQDKLKFIHVAGTNGKGSTSVMLASVLQAAGYKTGLYISPYIEDFCERIQINRNMIDKPRLAELTAKLKALTEALADCGEEPITEFEFVTALAFQHFYEQECDIVVLEVGMGGRFDATNIIKTPLASVITSISYDHIAILGDKIAKIAYEKAGIIKQDGITVLYPLQEKDAEKVIYDKAVECKNKLVVPDITLIQQKNLNIYGSKFSYKGLNIPLPLIGEHQIFNAVTAIETLIAVRERHGISVSDQNIYTGLSSVSFSGRLEKLGVKPLFLIDGAHNKSGVDSLTAVIDSFLPDKRKVIIMGMLADKDYKYCIRSIARHADTFLAVTPENPRALSAEEIAIIASEECGNVKALSDLYLTVNEAIALAGEDGVVIASGSLYLIGHIRRIYMEKFKIRQ